MTHRTPQPTVHCHCTAPRHLLANNHRAAPASARLADHPSQRRGFAPSLPAPALPFHPSLTVCEQPRYGRRNHRGSPTTCTLPLAGRLPAPQSSRTAPGTESAPRRAFDPSLLRCRFQRDFAWFLSRTPRKRTRARRSRVFPRGVIPAIMSLPGLLGGPNVGSTESGGAVMPDPAIRGRSLPI